MITWEQRRGQIKHLLYELCLIGRIDKATFCEQLHYLNNVEPIVRCKDCKYGDTFHNFDEADMPMKCLGQHYGGTHPDDYCSYGERREDAEP